MTLEDELELGNYIVYKDDLPCMVGTIEEVMEFTGYARNTVSETLKKSHDGTIKTNRGYKIFKIDEDVEEKHGRKKVIYVAYQNEKQIAMGTKEEVAAILNVKPKTILAYVTRAKKGEKFKFQIYKVDDLI